MEQFFFEVDNSGIIPNDYSFMTGGEVKAWPVRRAERLTATHEAIQFGILSISSPYRPARSVTGISLII